MAAVPSQRQPPPPNRLMRTSMPGGAGPNGISTTLAPNIPWTSLATAPYEGAASSTPPRIVPLGTDSQSRPVTVPSLAQGQQYVATVTVPLPLIPGFTHNQIGPPGNSAGPTPRSSVLTRAQDQLLLRASMTVKNLLPGMTVVRFTATPQGRSGAQVFNADAATGSLPAGQQYSSFMVNCTVTFLANQAVSGGVVTLATEGTLTRQAGGGV